MYYENIYQLDNLDSFTRRYNTFPLGNFPTIEIANLRANGNSQIKLHIDHIHVDGNGQNVNLSETHAVMNCLNFLQALRY